MDENANSSTAIDIYAPADAIITDIAWESQVIMFSLYVARGTATRDQAIIPRSVADAAEGANEPSSWS
jgi:hypothetical protein